jgi:hypothetical protein
VVCCCWAVEHTSGNVGGSTSDADLQYGCVLSVGNKAILPSNVFVPLSTKPTCLGSHINLYVYLSPVRAVSRETDGALCAVRVASFQELSH